jgi:hypothetical protein
VPSRDLGLDSRLVTLEDGPLVASQRESTQQSLRSADGLDRTGILLGHDF